jgi:hypothetical protein
MIRVLRVARRGAMKARVAAGGQLRDLVYAAPDPDAVLARDWATRVLQACRSWLIKNNRVISIVLGLVIGVWFIIKGSPRSPAERPLFMVAPDWSNGPAMVTGELTGRGPGPGRLRPVS